MPRLKPASFLVLTLLASSIVLADDPPKTPVQVPVPPPNAPAGEDETKPLPPVAIPDDPPPHEGALFDLPQTIEPPDIIVVEVLEASPGRPITGERLVRPDGTISLGFYGTIHVRGLTIRQAKIKVVRHMREFLNDEVLGLMQFVPFQPVPEEPPAEEVKPLPPGTRNPLDPDRKMEKKPEGQPAEPPPGEKKPEGDAKPQEKRDGRLSASRIRPGGTLVRGTRQGRAVTGHGIGRRLAMQEPKPPAQELPKQEEMVDKEPIHVDGVWRETSPADTLRVFVDVTAYNSKFYFVQGDVHSPGRLAFTGGETVLDALNYAGGLIPISEPTDIHLYRPARGGKPAKDYKIDLAAIHKGVATANLQLFPNDRLVVGRNPIVQRTTDLDRAAAPINSVLNTILQYSFTARSLAVINVPPSSGSGAGQVKIGGQNMPLGVADPTLMSPAQRDAMLKEWYEFLWSVSSKEGGAMVDEKAFRDALLKKLTPTPEPKQ